MPSFTTIYRAAVMVAIGAIVVKGWQLYGPSAEQVKTTAVSVVELAESTWNSQQRPEGAEHSTANGGGAAPPFAQSTQPLAADSAPPTATLTQSNTSVPVVLPNASPPASPELITPPAEKTASASTPPDDRVPALLSRLEQLGAAEPKLAPWGSSGHLYRCCCRAAPADSPLTARHFESVAEEPALAVEQVVAKVEAWKSAQRGDAGPRY